MAVHIEHETRRHPADDHGLFVAVIDREPEISGRVARAIREYETSSFTSIEELLDAGLQRISTVIIVLGPSLLDQRSIEHVGSLSRVRSGIGAILVAEDLTPELMRAALRAGMNEAVALREIDRELEPAARALAARLEQEVTGASVGRLANPGGGRERGRVTAVFSPKGGVGKSAISVNLATALARRTREPVILVDLDLQFGDLAVMLRLRPAHHVGEIAGIDDFDADFVRGLLVEHQPTGIWLLAAPPDPSAAQMIGAHAISRLIGILRKLAPHVVVDTPPILSDVVLQLLNDSDEVGLLIGMDVPSVKNARVALQALELVGIPADRILLVLNRADSKVNLAVKDVERALGRKIDVKIPSDVIVTQSINKGIPAVLEYERSQFARSLEAMAARLGESPANKERGS